MNFGKILAALTFFSLFSAVQAQEIDAERPDQSYGASVAEPGTFVGETGFVYTVFDEGDPAIVNSSLLRYGVAKRVELRLLVEEGRNRDRYIRETTLGFYPLALGAKLNLLRNHSSLPDLAILAFLKLPFTAHTTEGKYWSPAFIAALEKELAFLTITANTGLQQEAYEKSWVYPVSASFKFSLSAKVKFFTEYFAEYATGESPHQNGDAGLLYQAAKNIQVDLSGGSTLFNPDHHHFFNLGTAFKIGK